MKLKEAVKKGEDSTEENLTCCDYPSKRWTRIRSNSCPERFNSEIRCKTKVMGNFPAGNSVLMLVYARLCNVAGIQWSNKKYMNMKHLEILFEDVFTVG